MSEVSAWTQVWKINQRFLRALSCGGLAWLCWQGRLAGIDWLILLAVMFAAGTTLHGVIGVFQTVKVIAGTLSWSRFKKQAAKPKADGLADRASLKKGGML